MSGRPAAPLSDLQDCWYWFWSPGSLLGGHSCHQGNCLYALWTGTVTQGHIRSNQWSIFSRTMMWGGLIQDAAPPLPGTLRQYLSTYLSLTFIFSKWLGSKTPLEKLGASFSACPLGWIPDPGRDQQTPHWTGGALFTTSCGMVMV